MPNLTTRFLVATPLLIAAAASAAEGGETNLVLTLVEATERARATSPQLAAAREAVQAARGEERQAGAFLNPAMRYSREQTFHSGDSIKEDTALIEQPVEIGGQRGLRREAARGHRLAAEAALRLAEFDLAFEVTRTFALALAAAANLQDSLADLVHQTGQSPSRCGLLLHRSRDLLAVIATPAGRADDGLEGRAGLLRERHTLACTLGSPLHRPHRLVGGALQLSDDPGVVSDEFVFRRPGLSHEQATEEDRASQDGSGPGELDVHGRAFAGE